MKFEQAIQQGKVIVVAGAGISKDAPSNLPSWWDYNITLMECIGEFGAKALNREDNLLKVDEITNRIPVTSISEFFVDRIANKTYYPLLSLLNASQPNMHHLMLARLAKRHMIKAIVNKF